MDWLGRLSGKKVPVVRWSLFRQWWFPYLILTSLLGALYLGLWLAVSGIAGRPVVIAVGALAVWWFR